MLSALGKEWVFRNIDNLKVLTICQKHNVSDIIAQISCARNISQLQSFFKPTIRELMPEPFLLKDMESAVKRTIKAIQNNEKITIYGDYDVDGATSIALLIKFFNHIGITVDYYIPNRVSEGYGLNIEALQKIKENSSFIIVVDCGTMSIDEIDFANQNGLESVILDHHQTEGPLPKTIVVNPHRSDQEPIPYIKNLCAVGVVFFFLVAIQRELRDSGLFEPSKLPNLMNSLDLVALGTVCDVMPIHGLNRAFVHLGLELIQTRQNHGIRALLEITEVRGKITTNTLGFVLGPRINAGGRIGAPHLGTEILTTTSESEAQKIAITLQKLNTERQTMEKATLNEAINTIETQKLYNNPVLLVGQANWHPGIIGLLANRLKERYNKPAFVFTASVPLAKGSCRSVEGIDIGYIIKRATNAGILLRGGGHAMAAGFIFDCKKEGEFYAFLNEETHDFMKSYKPTLKIDARISLKGVTVSIVDELEKLEPFGVGNTEPKFHISRVIVKWSQIIKGEHIQCVLSDESGAIAKAMVFKGGNTEMEKILTSNLPIDIVCTLKKNSWRNSNSVQILIEDAMLTSSL
jgi:single-stranded-DNA-specific exonuclease